jgi:signal transduction histidine kinase
VRKLSTGLRPQILDEMGLGAAICWQAAEFQKRVGIRCRLKLPDEQIAPDKELSTAVFRIFQEVLTNVARHAGASSVDVDLSISGDKLILTVADDGIGISEEQIRSHNSLGLLGMRERAQVFGGEIIIRGEAGRGTTVSVSIPAPRLRA